MIHIGVIFLIVLLGCYRFGSVLAHVKSSKVRYSSLTSVFSVGLSMLLVRFLLGKSIFLIRTLGDVILYDGIMLILELLIMVGISVLYKHIPQANTIQSSLKVRIGSALLKIVITVFFFLGTFLWLWASWFVDFLGE